MKRKLFIAVCTTVIVVAVIAFEVIVTTIQQTPAQTVTQQEASDTSIAQYTERPNGGAGSVIPPAQNILSPIFFPGKEQLAPGCSLRFSLVPEKKAVDPGATINYTIIISNNGKETCENVGLSMYYTNAEHFVSSTPAPTASDYYWNAGKLGSGAAYQISLTTKNSGQAGDQMLSEGCVSGDNSPDICAQTVIFIQNGASSSPTLAQRISKINIPSILGVIWGQLFSKKELGIWVWDSVIKMTPAYAEEVIRTSAKNGFNVIYLTADDYIPITQIKDPNQLQTQSDNYMRSLNEFIVTAHASGLQVDVVGGAKDWAHEENRWKGYTLIDFVQKYNAKYPTAKIRNLQYDVEPYLLSDYDADKQTILREYVDFIDQSALRMKNVSAGFSIVVPHFYDKQQNWTPSFNYKGKDAYTFTHLLDVLAQKDDTSIIIMSYRNFFEENNGAKQISEPEIQEASDGNYATKIIVAQETGDVSPAYVTFHDYPKSALFDNLNQIQGYFKKYKNFNGVAVHYFDSFLKLE